MGGEMGFHFGMVPAAILLGTIAAFVLFFSSSSPERPAIGGIVVSGLIALGAVSVAEKGSTLRIALILAACIVSALSLTWGAVMTRSETRQR